MTKTEIVLLLRKALWNIDTNKGKGICGQVEQYMAEAAPDHWNDKLLHSLMQSWPGYSGDPMFPVPSTEEGQTSKQAFIAAMAENRLWDAKLGTPEWRYARLRHALGSYLVSSTYLLTASLDASAEDLQRAKLQVRTILQDLLTDVEEGKPRSWGLCTAIDNYAEGGRRGRQDAGHLLDGCMRTWKGHSGEWKYPVPAPEGLFPHLVKPDGAKTCFNTFGDKAFEGEYGKLRIELAKHVLSVVDTAPNLWGGDYPQGL